MGTEGHTAHNPKGAGVEFVGAALGQNRANAIPPMPCGVETPEKLSGSG